MARTRPVLTSIAIKPPCTSGTWRRVQRMKRPSASAVMRRTCTTSPTFSKSEGTRAWRLVLPSAFWRRAHVTSLAAITPPASGSVTPSIPRRALSPDTLRTTAGYHLFSSEISREISTLLSASRHAASSPSTSSDSVLPVGRQIPMLRS